jgi:hypothetical protein
VRSRFALLCALALLLGMHVPGESSQRERSVSLAYSLGTSEVRTTVGMDEDQVVAVVDDAHSGVVGVTVEVHEPSGYTSSRTGCNRVAKPAVPGSEVVIKLTTGQCGSGQVALATYGSVEVVFHKRPPKPVRRVASAANRWALLVGVQDYAGRTHSTVGADGDVYGIRAALLKVGWRSDHIRIVRGTEATADGIRDGIEWLVARSSPDTFTLLHYSGHVCIASRGPCPSGHAYLWAHDNRFISDDELLARIDRLQGYSWLDVAGCEAGAFDNGFSSGRRLFTASSRADETSYEDPGSKQSVWVQMAWTQGLVHGYADKQGRPYRATMRQMAAFGTARSTAYTQSGSRGPQHPQWRGGQPWWTLATPPGR